MRDTKTVTLFNPYYSGDKIELHGNVLTLYINNYGWNLRDGSGKIYKDFQGIESMAELISRINFEATI